MVKKDVFCQFLDVSPRCVEVIAMDKDLYIQDFKVKKQYQVVQPVTSSTPDVGRSPVQPLSSGHVNSLTGPQKGHVRKKCQV